MATFVLGALPVRVLAAKDHAGPAYAASCVSSASPESAEHLAGLRTVTDHVAAWHEPDRLTCISLEEG